MIASAGAKSDSNSQLKTWLTPPQLVCSLHVDSSGLIQHAEGDIQELFGCTEVQKTELSNRLRWSGEASGQLTDWINRSKENRQLVQAELEGSPGKLTPVELQAIYQGDDNYLIIIRSLFAEIVEQFAAQQLQILELLAAGTPLPEISKRIVLLIEDSLPGATGSILFLDPVKKCFRIGAAPNLPEAYNKIVDGFPIGPKVGSCGAALYHQQRVIVEDISSDPIWADYRQLILPLGLHACWSTPFFSEYGKVLGTFGIYYRVKRAPQPYEIAIVDAASHLAAVVASHHQNQKRLQDVMADLKESEQRLALALRGTDLGLWDWNIETGEMILGKGWLAMLGYAADELPYTFDAWKKLWHPEDIQQATQALDEHLQGKSDLYDNELRLQAKDGQWRWVQARGRVMERSPDGRPLRMTGTYLEIHSRKTAEAELQRIQRRYELVLVGSGAGLWDWNIDTGQCYFSPRVTDLLGYPEAELPSTWSGFLTLIHPDDTLSMTQAIAEHLEQHAPFEIDLHLLTKDGGYRWFTSTGQANYDHRGLPRQMAGSLIDIHERRSAEERVQENKRVLETLLGNLLGMAYRCRIDEFWTMEFVSQGCLKLTGYKSEDLVNNQRISYEEITHPEDRQRVRDEIYHALEMGRQFDVNYRIVTADGTVRHVWERGVGIHSALGQLEVLEGFITDVTSIRISQDKIAEQAALLDRAQDAIIVRDVDGLITYWNQAATRLFGWSQEEAIGKTALKLFFREVTSYQMAMQTVLKQGEWSGELRKFNRSNQEIVVESRWTLMRDEAGAPKSILTIDTDITEKKRIEAQFFRAQRMESIGTLAGGIAHDLNNVLAPIIMAIDLLRLSVRSQGDIELLNQMNTSAHRGASLVQQVLSFARGVEGRRVSINPSHLIKDVMKIIKDTLPKSITIRSHRSADLDMITGDPTQLHQVLLNLCVNARDAMPEGGTLSLLAENVKLDETQAAMIENARPGDYVCFIVEDTGTGIPPEVQDKIFEPFFTTKEIGKGTGLGLSTVLAIVRSHSGFIRIESTPDCGTSFYVYLPVSSRPSEASDDSPAQEIPRGHGECILIVDDEASVRSVLMNTLKTYGYEVLSAENGAESLAIFEREKDRIRVILTDMMMPVMDGPTMITNLRRLNAKQPIIATSGLSESINVAKATAAGVTHFLAKPYTAEMILQAVHEVLEQLPIKTPPGQTEIK